MDYAQTLFTVAMILLSAAMAQGNRII